MASGSSVTRGRCWAATGSAKVRISPAASRAAAASSRRICMRPLDGCRNSGAKLGGWIQPRVQQVARRDVGQGLQHGLLDAWVLDLELHDESFRTLALQGQITARWTAAADNRQLALLGI